MKSTEQRRYLTAFNTPEKKNQSEFSTQSPLSKPQSLVGLSPYKIRSLAKTPYLRDRKASLMLRKTQKLKKRQLLKQVLTYMILSKQMIYKTVFNNFRSLINTDKKKIILRGKEPERFLAQNIVWKAPINLQMSLIRAIIKQESNTTKYQKKHSKLSKDANNSIIILPDEEKSLKIKEKQAILILQKFAQTKIRKILRKFSKNVQCQRIKRSYCQRVLQRSIEKQRRFLQKLRLISKLDYDLILSVKRKTVENFLNKCLEKRDRSVLHNLMLCQVSKKVKQSTEKKRRQLSIYIDKNITIEASKKVRFWDGVTTEASEEEKIRLTLKKILMKRYFRKWHERAFFLKNLFLSAVKMACAPKISVQRSLWRLKMNAYYSE